jgi:SAM-dependent methyltransferase
MQHFDKAMVCTNCQACFPVVNNMPVLINQQRSIFNIADFVAQRETTMPITSYRLIRAVQEALPSLSQNMKAEENYEQLTKLLATRSNPRVLIIGGSIVGKGMQQFLEQPGLELAETDVSFGPRTSLICDAHDIPFADNTFDAVIAQAVLEHVVDPQRCVAEIHRVLNPTGVVYAETPFMQQVHMGRYDFHRFTHLGHRRLFRHFTEVSSGAVCGPGMALAWAYQYFLLSFSQSTRVRILIGFFSQLTAFYLKYLDRWLIDRVGTLDAASGYYFLGQKSQQVLSDRELITLYRGAMQ